MSRGLSEVWQNEMLGVIQPKQWGTTGGTGGTAAAPVPDASIAEAQVFTMTAATTVGAPVGARAIGDKLYLVLVQDGTGGRTIAWNSAYRNCPTPSAGTSGQRLSVELRYDGASWQFVGGSTAFA